MYQSAGPKLSFPDSYFKIRSRIKGYCIQNPKSNNEIVKTGTCDNQSIDKSLWYTDSLGRLVNRDSGKFLTTVEPNIKQGALLTTSGNRATGWKLDEHGRIKSESLCISYDAQTPRAQNTLYLWENWGSPSQMWYFERLGFLEKSQTFTSTDTVKPVKFSQQYTLDFILDIGNFNTGEINVFSTPNYSPEITFAKTNNIWKLFVKQGTLESGFKDKQKHVVFSTPLKTNNNQSRLIIRFNGYDNSMDVVIDGTRHTISPSKIEGFLPHGGKFKLNTDIISQLTYYNVWKDDLPQSTISKPTISKPKPTQNREKEDVKQVKDEVSLMAKISKLEDCIKRLNEKREAVDKPEIGIAPEKKDITDIDHLVAKIRKLKRQLAKKTSELDKCRNAFYKKGENNISQMGGNRNVCPSQKRENCRKIVDKPTIYNVKKGEDLIQVNTRTLKNSRFDIDGPYSITKHRDFKKLMHDYLLLKTDNGGEVGQALKDYVLHNTPITEHGEYYETMNKYAIREAGVCPPQYKPCPKNAYKWQKLANYYKGEYESCVKEPITEHRDYRQLMNKYAYQTDKSNSKCDYMPCEQAIADKVAEHEKRLKAKYETKLKCLERKYKQKLESIKYMQSVTDVQRKNEEYRGKLENKINDYSARCHIEIEKVKRQYGFVDENGNVLPSKVLEKDINRHPDIHKYILKSQIPLIKSQMVEKPTDPKQMCLKYFKDKR